LKSHAQTDDTTKYTYYQGTYGQALDRYWAKKVLRTPTDTIYSKAGIAILNGLFYYFDGTKWSQVTGSGGSGSSGSADSIRKIKVDTAGMSDTTRYLYY